MTKAKSIIEEIKLNENERYYLQISVRKSKTKNVVSLFHERTSHINDYQFIQNNRSWKSVW